MDGARRLGRRAVGARRGDPQRPGRQGPRARGLPDPGPGAQVEGHDADGLRAGHRRHQVLLDADHRGRRDPRGHQPDGLDRRGRLRGLPARPVARRRPVGPDHGGRQAAQDPPDRPVRGAPHRGRHLQLRLGHDDQRHAVPRHGPRAPRRDAGGGLHRQGSARRAPSEGRRPQTRRHRGRRRRAPVRAVAQVRRVPRRREGRDRHGPDLVAAARGRTSATCGCRSGWPVRAASSRSRRPMAAVGRPDRGDPVPRPEEDRPARLEPAPIYAVSSPAKTARMWPSERRVSVVAVYSRPMRPR